MIEEEYITPYNKETSLKRQYQQKCMLSLRPLGMYKRLKLTEGSGLQASGPPLQQYNF